MNWAGYNLVRTAAFAFALIAASAPIDSIAQTDPATRSTLLTQWEPAFRKVWSADGCVQGKQTWADYISWVHRFYLDGDGWFDASDKLAAKVQAVATRAALKTRMTTLGARVAGEWSKDNSCRKISTFGSPGILDFSHQLSAAGSADNGDGVVINAALDKIEKAVVAAIGPP